MSNTNLTLEEDKIVWVDCECLSPHHAIRIWHSNDHYWNEFIIEMRVNNYLPLWKRVVNAFKYVFNISNKDGYYDSFHLKHENVNQLIDMLNDFKNQRENQIKSIRGQ